MADRGLTKIDLGRIPLFRDIDTVTIDRDVEDWIFFYRDGQRVCVQGEPADSLIVILRGEVQILSQDMSMVTRRFPEVVGEQGFLSADVCRTADAIARGTVEVLRIPRAEV